MQYQCFHNQYQMLIVLFSWTNGIIIFLCFFYCLPISVCLAWHAHKTSQVFSFNHEKHNSPERVTLMTASLVLLLIDWYAFIVQLPIKRAAHHVARLRLVVKVLVAYHVDHGTRDAPVVEGYPFYRIKGRINVYLLTMIWWWSTCTFNQGLIAKNINFSHDNKVLVDLNEFSSIF